MQVMWLTDHMMVFSERTMYTLIHSTVVLPYIESEDGCLLQRSRQYHVMTQSGYCSAVAVYESTFKLDNMSMSSDTDSEQESHLSQFSADAKSVFPLCLTRIRTEASICSHFLQEVMKH